MKLRLNEITTSPAWLILSAPRNDGVRVCYTKYMQRGFSVVLLVFVVMIILFAGIWGYFFYNKYTLDNTVPNLGQPPVDTSANLNQTTYTTPASASSMMASSFVIPSGWQTFTNTKGGYRYSFKYSPELAPASDGRATFYLKNQPDTGDSMLVVFVLDKNSIQSIQDQYKSLPKRTGFTSELFVRDINGYKVVEYIEKKECQGECLKNDLVAGYELDVVGPQFSLSFVPQLDGDNEVSINEFRPDIELMAGSVVFD